MRKDNSWKVFLIAIGLLLIVIAPTTEAIISQVVAGLAMVILGIYLIKKQ